MLLCMSFTQRCQMAPAVMLLCLSFPSEGACKDGCVCPVVTSEGVSNDGFLRVGPAVTSEGVVMMLVCLSVPQ